MLSFASLSVRPALYALFEDWIAHLPATDLRPVLRSLILSLLPALEEETSEDFDRAFRIVENLQYAFSSTKGDDSRATKQDGYFWQCLFLAVITCPSRRQGAVNYLAQKLPKFGPSPNEAHSADNAATNGVLQYLSPTANAVISPEPGLLIRCFVCGLCDPQILIQRGFLELLVTHLPLSSPLLQERVGRDDLDKLIIAALHVLLRRDMSLNRRLWSWFLGPDPKENPTNGQPASPTSQRKLSGDAKADWQFQYFSKYGRISLERCTLAMFKRPMSSAAARARPFRICLSLMDKWEIGGSIVSHVFLPAIESVYQYSLVAPFDDTAEVVRSASLFFDGIEASLIWAKLRGFLRDAFVEDEHGDSLQQFAWIVQRFNIKDDEMLVTHIPYAALYLLTLLQDADPLQVKAEKRKLALDVTSMLLDLVPSRAFVSQITKTEANGTQRAMTIGVASTKKSLDDFYRRIEESAASEIPTSGHNASELLYELSLSLTRQALDQQLDKTFGQAASILLTLHSKTGDSEVLRNYGVFDAIYQAVDTNGSSEHALAFPVISSVLSLVSALNSSQNQQPYITKEEIATLEPLLTAQIWYYLSPRSPKYHVEAVKCIWQLHDLVAPDDCLEASLTGLVRHGTGRMPTDCSERIESIRRFAALWGHTIPAPPSSTKSRVFGSSRRSSAMPIVADTKQAISRQAVLTEPLMLILSQLDNSDETIAEVVKDWLQKLPTLDQVLNIHFDLLTKLMDSPGDLAGTDTRRSNRLDDEIIRNLGYIVGHFLSIVKHGNDWIWSCLEHVSPSSTLDGRATMGFVFLGQCCSRFVCNDEYFAHGLRHKAIGVLHILLSGPSAALLKSLDLDSRFIERLINSLANDESNLQVPLLRLVRQSLKLRLMNGDSVLHEVSRPRSSLSAKRSSIQDVRLSPNASNTALIASPPPQLLNCLLMGFSSRAARPYLDRWIEFLSQILPVFSDAIFTSLIPLVECFCNELGKAHEEFLSLSKIDGGTDVLAPEATVMALLEALEMILSRARECLNDDQNAEPTPRPTSQPRSLLSNMTPGVFRAEGPPSRTAQANSRLTLVLALQDAIRVSLRSWIWASHHSNVEGFDKTSGATTAYNALRVRNRTRQLMEQIFDAENLESLEVVIANWCYAADTSHATASLDLLYVMQVTRPKNVVPAILDALCSRTNPIALPPSRQSSQTINLEAQEISLFLYAYLQSIEDDAMDEVWSDCIAFLKDVLANPLPYRLVLPALLSVILLLAQKVDNTNFGEQRKMRRELGDIFLRLLAATFTTMPSGYITEPGAIEIPTDIEETSNSVRGRRNMRLVVVLSRIVENINVILETNDRTASAMNSISVSLIGPLFHAKSFPGNVTSDVLTLLLQMCKKAPLLKPWKKEMLSAFDDARLLTAPVDQMEHDWFPVLHQWCLHDKERMPDLLSRLTAPSSAGIMFGVGATAARLEADRKTQLNLRRICILLLSSPEDTFATDSQTFGEKLVELFDASSSSSPSSAIKAELFMMCRALALSMSAIQLGPMWSILNDNLQAALMSLLPESSKTSSLGNLALLQACKLLDLLIAVSPDEFQLHEWLYISDTIDAVYRQSEWTSSALTDQLAETLASDGIEDGTALITPTPTSNSVSGDRRPLINNDSISDKDDLKAMTRDDFAPAVLRPFFSQLSIHAYEGVYSMESPSLRICRRNLLEDLLDLATIVE